ncbi:MetS family NSS transporter small subunit [Microbacterium sediminis]|uniref:MetS family NSS transporter small subunit n=1 Tax=Microbacterium sediminis TaxID=904291 RepID=UPI000AECE4CD|nr:MetS family NSS transporter small subunit [Microbacterium sediminis]QBR75037.1 MetS family NSS transporter small subunit [Microbacterium sediminis]
MTPIAILFLVIATVLVWGGLVASIVFLARRPEVASYPDGGIAHDDRDEDDL